MDVLTLSRLQFALTAMFHFIFVPLTLGLVVMVAVMETLYVKTGNPLYLRMTKFWGKLFLINFALGVVTGITLEFQFGMNWAQYSRYVGDIFGAPLAIEATVSFFLESTFIGVWIFGWRKVSKKVHALAIWLVAIGSNLSALWILIANAWMQHPVGFVLRNNRAEMADFQSVVFSPYAWTKFFHTLSASYVAASFFVLGVSAWHILRNNEVEFFKKSFRIASVFGAAAALMVFVVGDIHGSVVARAQPEKLAAMESVWETERGVPLYLLLLPDEENRRNAVEALPIPKLVSFLSYRDPDAEVKGLNSFPDDEIPPVTVTFLSFRGMVMIGPLLILISLVAAYIGLRDKYARFGGFLRALVYLIPLPYVAIHLGWLVAEIGRQPWIVYRVLRTSEAVSEAVSLSQVAASLVGFVLLYGFMAAVDIYLMFKFGRKGPEGEAA